MPHSRFALHRLAPPQFTVCALFLALTNFVRLSQAPLDTCLESPPLFLSLSVHDLQFTVYAPLRKWGSRTFAKESATWFANPNKIPTLLPNSV